MLLGYFVEKQGFTLQFAQNIIIEGNQLNSLESLSNSFSNITVLSDCEFELKYIHIPKHTKS